MEETQKTIALLIEFNESTSYTGANPRLKITARPVFERGTEDIDYPSAYETDEKEWTLKAQFRFWSDSPGIVDDIGYETIESADVPTLERCLSRLKKVNKSLDKRREEEGMADSAAEAIIRFAKAIGAKKFVVISSDRRKEITGESYRWLSAPDARYHINDKIHTFRQPHEERAA